MKPIPLTVCVVECGLFQSLAHTLVGQFERVLYFRDSNQSFPTSTDIAIGTGYGFERIYSWEEHYDEVDIWIFPDIGYGKFQEWLKAQGKRTFGCGVAQEFEQYRVEAKEIIREAGLPVNEYEVVIGMEDLRDYLQSHDDVYVKVSLARGITESFHSQSYDLVKVKLDEIEFKLGFLADQQEWIVEQPIPAIGEIGYDGITINGRFWDTGIAGVEKKDCGYFCAVKPYTQLPKSCTNVNTRLAPQFKDWGFCGWWSSEIRPSDKKDYLIDPTCRMASPAGECYQNLVANWGEIIDAGSLGKMVQPKWSAKFAAQAMLVCPCAASQQVPVYIKPAIRPFVHLYHSAKIDGVEVVFPTDAKMVEIGSVVGIGNTPDEAIKACQKNCEGVEAYQLEAKCDVLDGARRELAKFMTL